MCELRWYLVLAIASIGCVGADQNNCANGLVCPGGYTCVTFGCASSEQISVCTGKADGEVCTTTIGAGVCADNACLVPHCGNQVVEGPEACDDGNQLGGDGCNGTCTSDESCGNGITELGEACDCGTDVGEGQPISLCAGTLNGGTVCKTDCQLHRCGDGVVAPGEVCDDGNTTAGDGCSPDCQSDETCGNAVLDYLAGEQCDDANLRSGDGCSSSCVEEIGQWQLLNQGDAPTSRYGHTMAFDTDRGRSVIFGGFGASNRLSDTWELDGQTWVQITSDLTPPARVYASMAYDAARHRMVMYGGFVGNGVLGNDTWELDSSGWTQRFPASNPGLRYGAAMAYDPRRGKIVLVGGAGAGASGASVDVFEYDGTTWTKITTTNPPTSRYGAALVYDPTANRLVLIDGSTSASVGETWVLSGTTWTQLGSNPGARVYPTAVFDTVTGRINIFGGGDGISTYYADQRELVSNVWQTRTTTGTPAARTIAGMTHDPRTGRTYIFGGFNGPATGLADTDVLSGSAWTTVTPIAAPDIRSDTSLAYDSRRGRMLMFGGDRYCCLDNDTWSFDGVTWRPVTTATNPGEHFAQGFAYDSARDRVVMFGGYAFQGSGELQSTYEFDGTDWHLMTPSLSPDPRYGLGMVYDSRRRKMVMFGGYSYAGQFDWGDTWEYDGTTTTWMKTATTGPEPRNHMGMAYDPVRGRTVLFGGRAGSEQRNDTWEYDGTSWTQLPTTVSPPIRMWTQMVYDASRNKMVVFGGEGGSFDAYNDLWELDITTTGATWRQVVVSALFPKPPQRYLHALGFDIARDALVLFGGTPTSGSQLNDTWLFRQRTQDADTCDGSDRDGDKKIGCSDDECWTVCSPECSPFAATAACPTTPRCGDGVCEPIETCHACPTDCTGCPVRCGDGVCDSSETSSSCPGDCP